MPGCSLSPRLRRNEGRFDQRQTYRDASPGAGERQFASAARDIAGGSFVTGSGIAIGGITSARGQRPKPHRRYGASCCRAGSEARNNLESTQSDVNHRHPADQTVGTAADTRRTRSEARQSARDSDTRPGGIGSTPKGYPRHWGIY
jgi:hypothetical protein